MSLLLSGMMKPPGGSSEVAFEGIATSGSNSASTTQTVDNPAYSSGWLVTVGYELDGNYAVQGPVYLYDAGGSTPTQDSEMSGINGETVTREAQSDDGDQTAATGGLFSYIATSTESAGSGLALAIGSADQTSHVCAAFSNASDIVGAVLDSGNGTTATSPATTAVSAGGMVCAIIAIDGDPLSAAASGWTIRDQIDVGASAVAFVTRDALTTASESVSAAGHTISAAEEWVAITFIVEPA